MPRPPPTSAGRGEARVTTPAASASKPAIGGSSARGSPTLRAPHRRRVQLLDRGGMHVARELSTKHVRPRRVDVLRHAAVAELHRQRQLLDRRSLPVQTF